MLPHVSIDAHLDLVVKHYLEEVDKMGFCGDIETAHSSRIIYATDNSVYQQLPSAVVYPKNTADVSLLMNIAQKNAYERICFSPRGGGTGTNGQSLTHGVVIDLARYMNQVLEINPEQGWVRVQSGLVKDALNDAVSAYGLFFSPELSTSNRATIGGMINTDASGQGSLVYGKTSDHVLSLQCVLADGSVMASDSIGQSLPSNELAYQAVVTSEEICRRSREQVLAKFPPLNRFLTGYDLKHAITDTDEFNVHRLICGSEGTLGIVTEAKLNLTPIPKYRVLVNIKYASFEGALKSAPLMVELAALSVETIDSTVLNLAKNDIIWHSVSPYLSDCEQEILGLNMVEFAAGDKEQINAKLARLTTRLDEIIERGEFGMMGYQICRDLLSIGRIYAMRKKAVGLLGASKGRAKPVAFAEDTCVPPENLADFIKEYRALLDSHQLRYGMFGHVDAGVLHVRPALDLCDPMQEQLMHTLSDEVVKLVAKYKGLMWGEHGKGYRSEYGPNFFGETLFEQLRRIKTAFDPTNKINPGKICTPIDSHAQLVKVSATKRAHFDRTIARRVRDGFSDAVNCNGNGLCFNYDTASPMCPSYKATGDRRMSPKGRAGLIREWLRLLNDTDIDLLDLEQQLLTKRTSFGFKKNPSAKKHQEDFSHQVYQAMASCLACKACDSQCPVKVDVASFRSRFLMLYHSRYQRPYRDHLVAHIERLLPLMAKTPTLINKVLSQPLVQSLCEKSMGYIDAPLLSTPLLTERTKQLSPYDYQHLAKLPTKERRRHLLIVQDPFTSFYDAGLIEDFVSLLTHLGITPILLPFKPNGKAQHIKGFLKSFTATATHTAEFLTKVAELGIPMVGVDPAMVLCYRDEYQKIPAVAALDFSVLTVNEWFTEHWLPTDAAASHQQKTKGELSDANGEGESAQSWYLFAHCTEKTKLPNSEKDWQRIFAHFGAALYAVPVGCCGMAGTFGHETDKYALSKRIYEMSWHDPLAKLPKDRCLITGYSCRTQTKRLESFDFKHPLQGLLSLVRTGICSR